MSFLKNLGNSVRRRGRKPLNALHRYYGEELRQHLDVDSLNQQMQMQLKAHYVTAKHGGIKLYEDIKDAGFRVHSEFEEDGIILYILSTIGVKTKKVVELCCGQGRVCMSANLIVNHAFQGYLFDGSAKNILMAQSFFKARRDCKLVQPVVRQAWVTRENVNDLLTESGVNGEIDLLSIDVDGNDYHIWKAINVINPRLCVFETNDIVPTHLSLTIPYRPDFDAAKADRRRRFFRSVSLLAMTQLSEAKGYRLISSHKHGFNVFFLRNDILPEFFPKISLEAVHSNPWTARSQIERWPDIADLDWIEV